MLYLLDADTLIRANRDYYPLDRVPEFWDWLLHQAAQGNLKLPVEMIEEIKEGTDAVSDWISEREHSDALTLDEDVDMDLLRRVTAEGYAPDLNDQELEIIGRDPFLIAHALGAPDQRIVVTAEVSKPSKQRANRKVPDVCNQFGIRPMDSFGLIRALDFSTSWRAAAGV
ncbi:DUF4411 family protein [Bradyrhizobium stylosanthis]|uniref:DUF4411 family protein n=1 Tax=Bradyrhizobium stylosanthis TaxID=1803665 RepID=UPI0007C457B8|nr:DUF4411 family protein [Bradyrhizobium stylosanthis]